MFVKRINYLNRGCRSYIFPYRLSVQSSYWRPGYTASAVHPLSADPFGVGQKFVRLFNTLMNQNIERVDIGDPIDVIYIKMNDGCASEKNWKEIEQQISSAFCLVVR